MRLLAFGLVFFVVEKVFWVFLLVSPELEVDKRLERVITGNMNRDIIVYGSSRGARNIIAGQIGDSLGLDVYNLSYPGSDILFHEFLLRSTMEFNTPPIAVILVVDEPHELFESNSIKFRYDRLYPLAKYNFVNNEMINRGQKQLLSKSFVLARINKRNFDLREKRFGSLDTIQSCGSMPISFQKKGHKFDYEKEVEDYDVSNELPEKLEAFKSFIELCNLHDISLFVIFPPNFKARTKGFEKRIEHLVSNKGVCITYRMDNLVYRDSSYYYDNGHLMKQGAEIYTNEVIGYLKKHL